MMQVLYSDQTDLTKLRDGLDKDGVQRLFSKSARPQRRSLMMSRTMNGVKGQYLSNFNFSSFIATGGDNWARKSSTGACLGSNLDCSPSKDQSQTIIQHRRLRYRRYNRCRSVHVESSSAAKSARSSRSQGRNSSPVRHLRSGSTGPWDPTALAAGLGECSIQELEEEAQSQDGLGEQALVEHAGTKIAARVTWCAPSAAVGVLDHLVTPPRRKTADDMLAGCGGKQVWAGEWDPASQMKHNLLYEPSTVCGESSRDEEACNRLAKCVNERDQSSATCCSSADSVTS